MIRFSDPANKILVAASILCVAGFLFVSMASVFYPYDLDLYEGNLFPQAARLAGGEQIYGPEIALKEPFIFSAYGPLYYAFLGGFLRFTGITFWPGRLISLLATVATALIIYRTVKLKQGGTTAAIIALTVFTMMPPTWAFGSLQRVDAFGVFWSVLAIALILCASGRLYFLLAGGAVALALLTKPTLITAGVALFISSLLTKRFKNFVIFVLAGCSIFAVAAALMMLTGNGGYWFILANASSPFSTRTAIVNIRGLAQSHTVIITMTVAIVSLISFQLRNRDFPSIFILSCLLISGSLGLITCGRTGASINYFYEFTTILALFVGLEFDKIALHHVPAERIVMQVFLTVALITELLLFRSGSIQGRLLIPQRKAPVHARLIQDIVASVPANEPIMSDYPDLVMRANRTLYFTDVPMYTVGPQSMRSQLAEYLAEKRLAAIISIGRISFTGYKLVEEYGYVDQYSSTGQYYPGPLLYLREDLWEQRAKLMGRENATR